MRRFVRAADGGLHALDLALVPLAAAWLALPAAAQPRSPHDVTTYGVVYRVPEMDRVVVSSGIAFGDGERRLDLYVPPAVAGVPGATRRAAVPVVVFANVTGLPFRSWEIYRDWARLVAAHGMAGVVYESDRADPRKSLDAVMAHLSAHGAELGVDPTRAAVWACSANVSLALPWLMGSPPPGVRAAVLYYGATTVPALRKDLPVFYVLAGRDAPSLIDGMRGLFARAAREGAPWTMANAASLTHAFDALDEGSESRQLVKETVAWLVDRIVAPVPAGPAPSPARLALTHVFGQELNLAAGEYRKILAVDPKDTEAARGLAVSLARAGRAKEAIPELRRAISLGADDAQVRIALGQALLSAGETAAGVAELKAAIAKGASPSQAYVQAGMPALLRHDTAAAVAAWESVLPAIEDAAARRTVLYNLACAHALGGEKERALVRLGEAVDAGFGPRAAIEADDDLGSLRADPRFEAILARVKPAG